MSTTVKVLGISGSLRKASVNTALLRAAQELAPEGMEIEIYTGLVDIPPYDDDVRLVRYPAIVEELRAKVRRADALVFASPEYNRSFSGVLKNAIDWVSRPPEQPFEGKVASVIGAGPGAIGTALGNYHLRQVLSILSVHVVPGPEVLVGGAAAKFDADGRLTDENTRKVLGTHLAALKTFALRMK
jgi:chromate reductase, NAD(P)H dehydrogenase (quinone)